MLLMHRKKFPFIKKQLCGNKLFTFVQLTLEIVKNKRPNLGPVT